MLKYTISFLLPIVSFAASVMTKPYDDLNKSDSVVTNVSFAGLTTPSDVTNISQSVALSISATDTVARAKADLAYQVATNTADYVDAFVLKQEYTNQLFDAWFDGLFARTNNWNAAYGWGNHALAGYMGAAAWLDWLGTNTYVKTETDSLALAALATNKTELVYVRGRADKWYEMGTNGIAIYKSIEDGIILTYGSDFGTDGNVYPALSNVVVSGESVDLGNGFVFSGFGGIGSIPEIDYLGDTGIWYSGIPISGYPYEIHSTHGVALGNAYLIVGTVTNAYQFVLPTQEQLDYESWSYSDMTNWMASGAGEVWATNVLHAWRVDIDDALLTAYQAQSQINHHEFVATDPHPGKYVRLSGETNTVNLLTAPHVLVPTQTAVSGNDAVNVDMMASLAANGVSMYLTTNYNPEVFINGRQVRASHTDVPPYSYLTVTSPTNNQILMYSASPTKLQKGVTLRGPASAERYLSFAGGAGRRLTIGNRFGVSYDGTNFFPLGYASENYTATVNVTNKASFIFNFSDYTLTNDAWVVSTLFVVDQNAVNYVNIYCGDSVASYSSLKTVWAEIGSRGATNVVANGVSGTYDEPARMIDISAVIYSNSVSQMVVWTNATGSVTNMAVCEGGTWKTNAFGSVMTLPDGIVTNGQKNVVLDRPRIRYSENGSIIEFSNQDNTLVAASYNVVGNDFYLDSIFGEIIFRTHYWNERMRIGMYGAMITGNAVVTGTNTAAVVRSQSGYLIFDSGSNCYWHVTASNGLFYASDTNGVRQFKFVTEAP